LGSGKIVDLIDPALSARANTQQAGKSPTLTNRFELCGCFAKLRIFQAMLRILNIFSRYSYLLVMLALIGLFQPSSAQNSTAAQETTHKTDATKEPSGIVGVPAGNDSEQKSTQQSNPSRLVLGPGDEVEISVYGAPDLSGHTRVSADGNISMPLVGYIRIAGLTSSEAEGAIENQLRQNNILNDPQVSVFAKEYRSGGVSVVGEVAKPGSYSTLGPHRLFDVLQAAGGLTEKAANLAVISHRGSDRSKTVEISKDPAKMAESNVEIQPGDTIVVPAAPIVYVLGEVVKPGGYILGSSGGVTVLRVVAAAGGPTRTASVGGTKMLRRTPDGLQQLPVPLKNLLRAKAPDMPLQPDDIIFVPNSRFKEALNLGALAGTLGTVALYRIP
jgi:polysaccharide export outer membrane protein